jgi:hypothetical protein
MRVVAVLLLVLVAMPLASAGCNFILGIDDQLVPPHDAGSDARNADVDSGVKGDTGPTRDAVEADNLTDDGTQTSSDRREPDGAEGGKHDGDAGDERNTGSDAGDGSHVVGDAHDASNTGHDAGDAGNRIILLRGTIGTLALAPAPAGTIRLVDHGIAVPWKSCNPSRCVSGGIAP